MPRYLVPFVLILGADDPAAARTNAVKELTHATLPIPWLIPEGRAVEVSGTLNNAVLHNCILFAIGAANPADDGPGEVRVEPSPTRPLVADIETLIGAFGSEALARPLIEVLAEYHRLQLVPPLRSTGPVHLGDFKIPGLNVSCSTDFTNHSAEDNYTRSVDREYNEALSAAGKAVGVAAAAYAGGTTAGCATSGDAVQRISDAVVAIVGRQAAAEAGFGAPVIDGPMVPKASFTARYIEALQKERDTYREKADTLALRNAALHDQLMTVAADLVRE